MHEQVDYIIDHGWQFTYHATLSPSYIRFSLAMAGIEAPAIRRYCELAYGYGVSLLIHAACNQDIAWMGTDINPQHADFARNLARGAGLGNVVLLDQAFEALAAEIGADAFDVATNTGTWTWLAGRDQAAMLSLVSKGLSHDGLFGLSYATLPGQESSVGLTRLLAALSVKHRQSMADARDYIPATLRDAIAFLDTNPGYFGLHWGLRETVEGMLAADPAHLAHEYFNHHFRPVYFSEIAEQVAAAGLAWLSSWSLAEHVAGLRMTPRQAAYLESVPGIVERQQILDLMLNRPRRNDLFARSGAVPRRADRLELVRSFRFVAVEPLASFKYVAQTGLGEIALARSLYAPLIAAFARLEPLSFDVLCRAVAADHSADEVADALAILTGEGIIHPLNPDAGEIERSRRTAQSLNRKIIEASAARETIRHLGSPLTGSGIAVSRRQQIFLLGHARGARTADTLASFVHDALIRGGAADAAAVKGGPSALAREANEFLSERLAHYRALLLVGED